MKKILPLLLLTIAFTSCKRRSCETVGIQGIELSADNNKLNDTLLVVKRYQKGTNFLKPIDSFSTGRNNAVIFDSSTRVTGNFNYEFLCRLQPSGKEIRITEIDHANERSERVGFSCVNTIHYKLNGIEKEQKGYFTMPGYIISLSY